jgi:REP element-mobilizing transposase RayT
MPRPPRIQASDVIYHVMSRGVRQQPIYVDDQDRKAFLSLLAEAVTRYSWRLSTYCLMTTHYHLVLQTPNANLSAGMQWLKGRHAQWFNWRHGHEGHVFHRRFHSVLVDSEWQFLTLIRYVLLNPVRAGICRHAADWKWSSYRAVATDDPAPLELALDSVLGYFGHDRAIARAAFVEFIRSGEPS